ncbi:hypothetical protein GBA52_025345 [Prunus armeniaca]|nr:hypothetical protein GBA52_025345 [Prunus armeniaca]
MGIMEKYTGRPNVEKNGGVLAVDLDGNLISHYYDPGLSLVSSVIKIGNQIFCGSIFHPYMLRLNIQQYPTMALERGFCSVCCCCFYIFSLFRWRKKLKTKGIWIEEQESSKDKLQGPVGAVEALIVEGQSLLCSTTKSHWQRQLKLPDTSTKKMCSA